MSTRLKAIVFLIVCVAALSLVSAYLPPVSLAQALALAFLTLAIVGYIMGLVFTALDSWPRHLVR